LEHLTREELRRDPEVWRIICNGGIDDFVDALNGYNCIWSNHVANSWDNGRVIMDGKHFSINPKLIEVTTGMENSGQQYKRDMKTPILKI